MNKQETFDKIWSHFITHNNGPSIEEHGMCLYRSPNGNRCAVGLLLPDSEYDPSYEGRSIHLIPYFKNLSEEDSEFLVDLQRCHDRAATSYRSDFSDFMRKFLTEVAEDYRLETPNDV